MMEKLTINNIEKRACTGCGSCVNVCPVQAITMVQDNEGFFYPKIVESQCISCNACYHRCPVNISTLHNKDNYAFAAVHKKPDRVLHSSSAGVFYELANQVIAHKGFVCGAAFDVEYMVKHILVSSTEELRLIQGSKYVQSYCGDVYSRIEVLLKKGIEVLFSGTPCQVAGLRSFLRKVYPNLYTVDLICHGTPSPGLFRHYLQLVGADEMQLHTISFREKNHKERTTFRISINQPGSKVYTCFAEKDPYYNLFLSNMSMRECCYQCKYAVPDRVSDITLGDCANAGNCLTSAPADAVKSIVVIHTEKGQKLFEAISEQIQSEPCSYESEVRLNKQLHVPVQRPKNRNFVLANVNEITLSQLRRYMIAPSIKERFKKYIIRNTPAVLRKQIITLINKLKRK